MHLSVMWILEQFPEINNPTYSLAVIAKQHQARFSDDTRLAGSRDFQGLTINCGPIIHQRGAIESHFLQREM